MVTFSYLKYYIYNKVLERPTTDCVCRGECLILFVQEEYVFITSYSRESLHTQVSKIHVQGWPFIHVPGWWAKKKKHNWHQNKAAHVPMIAAIHTPAG